MGSVKAAYSHQPYYIDIDYLMFILKQRVNGGFTIDKARFQDLEYDDNIALLAETAEML